MKRLSAFLLSAVLLSAPCTGTAAGGPPAVSAASAILVDAGSGRVLYQKDAHSQRLIASTTKLLTALVVAVFLAIPYWKGKYFSKPGRKGGATHA